MHQEIFSLFYVRTWDELVETYKEQIAGLVEGSADILQIENITDTLNPKADTHANDEYFEETSKERLQVMLSV